MKPKKEPEDASRRERHLRARLQGEEVPGPYRPSTSQREMKERSMASQLQTEEPTCVGGYEERPLLACYTMWLNQPTKVGAPESAD